MDDVQRLATMMAMMVLGAPQVYRCWAEEAQGVSRTLPSQYLDTYPGDSHMIMAEEEPWELNLSHSQPQMT
jgi:hypothetical protein